MTATDVRHASRDRLHPQSRAIVDHWYEVHGCSREFLTVDQARDATVRCLTAVGPPLPEVRDVMVPARGGALRVRLYRPAGAVGTLLFMHGGGWVTGTVDTFDALSRTTARAAGCNVVSVDYRLAPEAPFPGAVDDCYDALLALARGDVFDADQVGPIAVGGMSAGGNLATVGSLLARDLGGPEIAFQLLVVPVCDADLTRDSYRTNAVDLGLEVGEMRWFWDHYCPVVEERDDWRASPLRAHDLSRLPPASVVVADCDPLVDEGVAYAAALHRAGVDVLCSRWYGMHHGFFGNSAIDAGVMSLTAEAARMRRLLDGRS
jgi:acetyl esterase